MPTEYAQRVTRYLEGIDAVSTGACPGCKECELSEEPTEHERDLASEPWFSWSPCEICHGIAGNRYPWHGILDGNIIHGSCCEDCVMFLNYGTEPTEGN